jgi:hypothetical protein
MTTVRSLAQLVAGTWPGRTDHYGLARGGGLPGHRLAG